MPHLRRRLRQGFGLIETVVGAAIIGVVLFGAAQIGQFVFRLVEESNFKLSAAFLAEEGLEVVRLLRDTSWATNIAPRSLCTDYYLVFSAGTWQLDLSAVPPVDGIFDRRIQFQAVHRDSSDVITTTNCTLSGSDPNARKITVSLSWWNRGRQATTALSTYLTNLFNN